MHSFYEINNSNEIFSMGTETNNWAMNESELIILHFPIIAKFITESLLEQKNSVFVHCSAGVSRSATAIISYLMKKEEISYEKAEQMVSSKRRQIAPNVAFVEQLKLWEQLNYRLEGDSEKHLSFKRLQILHKAFRSITPYLDQISSGSILFKIASIIITEASKDEKLISSEQKEKLLGLIEQQDHQFQKVLQKCLESNYFPSFTSIDYKKNKFYSNFIKILAEY
ncbi:map kinase phosphatase with leucine-rich repeats protein [Anaeramoeba flamelloides]|uniref:protein-tyrosine-phosphatase n=1 Tax=Anaeramoeba flamelloides TaxID=1746091 RepID=A0AAV7ZRV9_9EUKA|nr:map kinase phosphatase with leucine-rich repeats protein [Anaeramoeba flamelloides]